MSQSMSFFQRLLARAGFNYQNQDGSKRESCDNRNKRNNRVLRTECLENRNLLSISYFWNPQNGSNDWNTTTANWYYIDQNGVHQDVWGNGVNKKAVFQDNNHKIVNVTESVRAEAIEFDTDGYDIIGNGAIGAVSTRTEIDVLPGKTASIKCTLTDGGGLNVISKKDIGTLVLSGNNNYSGGTVIDSGTLIASKPASLPGYSDGNVIVKDSSGTYDGDIANGYGYSTGSGNMDPNSTLILQGLGVNSNGGISGQGWNAQQIDQLTSQSSTVFENNTNFGIQVADGLEFDYGGHSFNAGTVGFVKTGLGILDFGSDGQSFAGPATIYEGTLKAADGVSHTFASSGTTSLYMTHRDAKYDLNNTSDLGLKNTISSLYGEPGSVLTNSSQAISWEVRRDLTIQGGGNFAGNVLRGVNGLYPSIFMPSDSLTFSGGNYDFWTIEIGGGSITFDGTCNVSVKDYIEASGESITWNSSGTFTINKFNSFSEGDFSSLHQNSGIIRVTPSGEPYASPSFFASVGGVYIGNENLPSESPEFEVLNSSLLISASLNQEGASAIAVYNGKLSIKNSLFVIGDI